MCKELLEATPQLLNWLLKPPCLISTFFCRLYVVMLSLCSVVLSAIWYCVLGRVGTEPSPLAGSAIAAPLQSSGLGRNAAGWRPLERGQSQTSSACGYTGLKSHFRYQCQGETQQDYKFLSTQQPRAFYQASVTRSHSLTRLHLNTYHSHAGLLALGLHTS